jgi:hypothetical protein
MGVVGREAEWDAVLHMAGPSVIGRVENSQQQCGSSTSSTNSTGSISKHQQAPASTSKHQQAPAVPASPASTSKHLEHHQQQQALIEAQR